MPFLSVIVCNLIVSFLWPEFKLSTVEYFMVVVLLRLTTQSRSNAELQSVSIHYIHR